MRVLHLGHNKERYMSGYYYQDYVSVLRLNHDVVCYGDGYPGHNPRDRIEDVFQKIGGAPDLIIVGAAWDRDDPPGHPAGFDPQPAIPWRCSTARAVAVR